MSLDRLTINVEDGTTISAHFNPNKLSFSKTVNWAKQSPKGRDVPEIQFTNAEARSISIDLLFDTYDTPDSAKKDVRDFTKKVFALAMVNSKLHRPPVCWLAWGAVGVFFQGVLEQVEQQFTLFLENGTPVRATSKCTFREWRTNEEDLQLQKLQSADVAKIWVVKRGDSLSSIAAVEYEDPSLWRPIAAENNLDDPLAIMPGMTLLIPNLNVRK